MADDPKKRGPADRIRVNVNQGHERARWASVLGVTQKRLIEAVKAVGVMVADVKKYLIERIEKA